MKPKFIVVKGFSEKKNVNYVSLVLDLGYRKIFLSSRNDNMTTLCAELLGIPVTEFLDKPNGNYEVK